MPDNSRWQAARRRLGVVAVLVAIMLLFCLVSDRPGDLEAGLIGGLFGIFMALLVEFFLWLRKSVMRRLSRLPVEEET